MYTEESHDNFARGADMFRDWKEEKSQKYLHQ